MTKPKHHQKEHDHDILQWKMAAILRDRCIRCWFSGKFSASEGWNAVPKESTPNNVGLRPLSFAVKA